MWFGLICLIWFGLIVFNGILNLIYLMANHVHIYYIIFKRIVCR